jgi:hypothetical protein
VDLAHLPVVAGQASQTIDQLLATVLLVQLNRTFTSLLNTTQSQPPAITGLTGMLSAVASNSIATDAAAQAAFAGISGELPSDIEALASAIGISLAAGDWTNLATYNRLRTLLKMAAATNGSGAALDLWSEEAVPAMPAAIAAVAALKGATPSSNWLSVAQSLNDPLRENRRDALVANLTAQRFWQWAKPEWFPGRPCSGARTPTAFSTTSLLIPRCPRAWAPRAWCRPTLPCNCSWNAA